MEVLPAENKQASVFFSNDVGQCQENQKREFLNDGNSKDIEMRCEITDKELRGILEVIAATGKFWHDWETLKYYLSIRLRQVLAEYSEAQMVNSQKNVSFGNTYAELTKRLDAELCSFTDGPPFTLQRLCEILLDPRSIYSNLSKLALALEKNLLVTSTMTICLDPYPSQPYDKLPEEIRESLCNSSNAVQDGVEAMEVADEDEEMPDAEEMDEDIKNGEKHASDEYTKTENTEESVDIFDKKDSENSVAKASNIEKSTEEACKEEESVEIANKEKVSADGANIKGDSVEAIRNEESIVETKNDEFVNEVSEKVSVEGTSKKEDMPVYESDNKEDTKSTKETIATPSENISDQSTSSAEVSKD